jgi:putative endonuclease
MYYVYFLRSIKIPSKTYVGYTLNLDDRLKKHNEGGSVYTAEHRPWKLVTYICFDSLERALAFEKYVKIGSGHAFAKKRLL